MRDTFLIFMLGLSAGMGICMTIFTLVRRKA
jgi:hypothetical protein